MPLLKSRPFQISLLLIFILAFSVFAYLFSSQVEAQQQCPHGQQYIPDCGKCLTVPLPTGSCTSGGKVGTYNNCGVCVLPAPVYVQLGPDQTQTIAEDKPLIDINRFGSDSDLINIKHGNAETFTINKSGQIEIGTGAPIQLSGTGENMIYGHITPTSGNVLKIEKDDPATLDTVEYIPLLTLDPYGNLTVGDPTTGIGTIYANALYSRVPGGKIWLGQGDQIVVQGLVGIGTSNPIAALDVAGGIKAENIQIISGSPAAGKVLTATNTAGQASWQTPSAALPAGTVTQTLWHNGTNWAPTSALVVDPVTARVGIGTTAPVAPLQITSTQDAILRLHQNRTGNVTSQIEFWNNDSVRPRKWRLGTAANSTDFRLLDQYGVVFQFYGDGSGKFNAPELCINNDCRASWPTGGGGVGGSGTTGNLPLWTGSTQLGNSAIVQSGTNVGIWTPTPQQAIHLSGNTRISGILEIPDAGNQIFQTGSALVFKKGASGDWRFRDPNNNDRLVIQTGGNVGIGTTTPEKQLHIKTALGNAEINLQSGSKYKWGIYHDEASEDLRFWNEANLLSITKGGRVGIGTTNPPEHPLEIFDVTDEILGLNQNGPGYNYISFKTDGTSNWAIGKHSDPNKFFIGSYVAEVPAPRLIILDTGEVGIGTTNPGPDAQFEVRGGGFRMNTTLSIPPCDSSRRGLFWYVQGAPGEGDGVFVCIQKPDNNYQWAKVDLLIPVIP